MTTSGDRSQPAAQGEPRTGGVAKATAISVVGQVGSQFVRFCGHLILARLLVPEAFGLMLIVNAIFIGLYMMSDVGVQPALIRHPRGDTREFLDTGWTIQFIRAMGLFVIGMGLAYPVAALYDNEQLGPLIAVTMFGVLFGGLVSTKLVELNRELRLGLFTAIQVGVDAVSAIGMVVVAWHTRSVWALVVGGLLRTGLLAVASHVLIRGRTNRFRWDRNAAREIFSFGKWIFVSTALTFVAMRLDAFLVPKLLPSLDRAGVYGVALTICAVPREVLGRVTSLVLMPALAASHRAGHDKLVSDYRAARSLMLAAGMFALLGVVALVPGTFAILYDERYEEGAWMAQLIPLQLWFEYLHTSAARALLAMGHSRPMASSTIVGAVTTLAASLLGFMVAGLPGFIVGLAFGSLAAYVYVVVCLRAEGVRTLRVDATWTFLAVGGGLTLGALPRAFGDPALDSLALRTAGLGAIVLLPYGRWVYKRTRAAIRANRQAAGS